MAFISLALVMAFGGFLVVRAVTDGVAMPPAAAQLIPPSVSTKAPAMTVRAGKPLKRSDPVRISIPRISVDAPVTRLGLDGNGQIQVPPLDDHNLAGWYDRSVTPGQKGTSVMLGHVDNVSGTSVFFYLKELRKGDTVNVALADGKTAHFVVDGVRKVAKTAFPASSVYRNEHYPALRLVTCGGPFDPGTGQYLDNIVVYAHLAA